jgi:hypothetical protein
VTIYGDHGSTVEAQVVDGTIQDFVLALDSPDARLLSLAVYVRAIPDELTLDVVGDRYAGVLTGTTINGFGPGVILGRETVELPAGEAIRLDSTLP